MSVKELQKQARQAISTKAYKEAIDCCKEALKLDKDNYVTLVLFGAASFNEEGYQQAEKAYQKAISIDRKNPLAWKGILELYTKTQQVEKLEEPLKELYNLTEDETKKKEYFDKLIDNLKSLNKKKEVIQKALTLWKNILNSASKENEFNALINITHLQEQIEQDEINAEIEKKLKKKQNPSEEEKRQIIKQVESDFLKKKELDEIYESIKKLKFPNSYEFYEKSIQRIIARRKLKVEDSEKFQKTIIQECNKMISEQPNSYFPYETLILIHDEDNSDISISVVKKLCLHVVHVFPNRALGWIGIAIALIPHISKNPNSFPSNKDLRDLLERGIKLNSILAHYQLSILLFEDNYFQTAIEYCKKALQIIEKRSKENGSSFFSYTLKLQILLAKAYQKLRKIDKAKALYEEILQKQNDNIEAYMGLGEINIKEKNFSKAEVYFNQILQINSNNDLALSKLGELCYLQNNLDKAKDFFLKAISVNNKSFSHYHWLGKTYWLLGGEYQKSKQYAQTQLLISAKLNPEFAPNYSYLGHYYHFIENDLFRAKKCYQKALGLDPLDEQAGIALSDLYVQSGQISLAVSIYREAANRSNSVHWAWLRLARYQQDQKQYDEAVVSFQNSLRVENSDSIAWQGLAETYRYQGKYTAALKAFTKALELDPSNVYSQYQMATIQRIIGSSQEAVQTLRAIKTSHPEYIPALKDLGETYLILFSEYLKEGSQIKALESLQQAVQIFEQCTKLDSSISCVWKLLGNSYTYFGQLPSIDISKMDISEAFELNSKRTLEMLMKGKQAYEKAIAKLTNDAFLYYDLGVNLFYQTKFTSNSQLHDKILEQSREHFKKAALLNPKETKFWNALGLVESTPELMQHSFIRALKCDSRNYTAWNHLGLLYLQYGKIIEAKKAFEFSLSITSTQGLGWLGQGLVNESSHKVDVFNVRQSYKYSVSLASEYQPQSFLAYGLFSYLMKDYSQASMYLQKYTNLQPFDVFGRNIYGLILEAEGFYQAAYDQFCLAEKISKSSTNPSSKFPVIVNSTLLISGTIPPTEQQKKLRINQARVLASNLDFKKAITENSQADPSSYFTWCFSGFASFQQANWDQSIQSLKKALELASNDKQKKRVYLLLSQVHFKKGNPVEAKNIISQCLKQYPTYVKGWIMLGVVSLLANDIAQLDTNLKTLKNLILEKKPSPKSLFEYYYLSFHRYCSQSKWKKAQIELTNGIHFIPTNIEMWNQFHLFLLDHNPDLLSISLDNLTSPLGEKLFPGAFFRDTKRFGLSYSHLLETDPTLLKWKYIAIGCLVMGRKGPRYTGNVTLHMGLSSIQKYVHLNPTDIEGWFLLAIITYAEALLSKESSVFYSASILLEDAIKKIPVTSASLDQTKAQVLFLHLSLAECFANLAASEDPENPNQQYFQQANQVCQEALQIFGEKDSVHSSYIWRQKARCMLMNPEVALPDIISQYQKSIEMNPQDVNSWVELSILYIRNEQVKAGETCLRYYLKTYSKSSSSNEATASLHLAHLLLLTKQYQEGIELINRVLTLFPKLAVALVLKGILHLKMNSFDESANCFEQALVIDSSLPVANYYLSVVHFVKKDYGTAESDLHYEKENNFRNLAPVFYQLGRVASACGKNEEAIQFLEEGIQHQPENETIQNELNKLKSNVQS